MADQRRIHDTEHGADDGDVQIDAPAGVERIEDHRAADQNVHAVARDHAVGGGELGLKKLLEDVLIS